MNKLESPSPKNSLCQVWLKLAEWFLRRRFFNFVNVFSLFRNYLPLEKAGFDNANDDDDNDGQRTNFEQKSSLEPLAQVS